MEFLAHSKLVSRQA